MNDFFYPGKRGEIKDQNIDSKNASKNIEIFETEKDIKEPLSVLSDTKKIKIFFVIILAGLFILLTRIFLLQIIKGAEYRDQAEINRIRIENITAQRGVILDRNNNILAKNIPDFSLVVVPSDLPKDESDLKKLIKSISGVLEIEEDEIEKKIENLPKFSYQPSVLVEKIEYLKAIKLETISSELAGVSLNISSKREYPYKEIAAHLLGYNGKINEQEKEKYLDQGYFLTDWIGKTGVEKYYEKSLKGENGKKKIEVNSLGKEQKIVATEDPEAGENLELTIDIGLQEKAALELESGVKKSNSTGGAIIALDPRNGEVLAIVSYPNFDSNLFIKGLSQEEYDTLFNDPNNPLLFRAIAGEYPSGSTIKPFVATAALEDGIISKNTTVNSVGGIRIGEWFFPDWKSGGHGITNVTKAIAESVNTFFYTIGGGTEEGKFTDGLGVEKIDEWAEKFGFSQKLGIDLPGEENGFLPTPEWKEETKKEKWYIGDTYHLAIGQGDILVTPLQIAAAYSVIANKGNLYQPQVKKGPSKIINQDFVSSQNIDIVREGLRQAVLSGSAQKMKNLSVSSAAKTGTAEFGDQGKSHAWFVCFAPYENPEIVLVVLLEEGGEGSAGAQDVAINILNWYFSE